MRPTVLIAEPNPSGHRLQYVSLIAAYALRDQMHVILATTPEAVSSVEFAMHLEHLRQSIEIVRLAEFNPSAVENLAIRVGASVTVIPDGDRFGIAMATRRAWRGGPLSVLIMRGAETDVSASRSAKIKTAVKRAALRRAGSMPRVRIIRLASATSTQADDCMTARDPVSFSASEADVRSARIELGLSRNRYWFGVLGAITARKNVGLILEALGHTSQANFGLLVAGKISADVLATIKSATPGLASRNIEIVTVDRLLTDIEIDSYVSAVDCLVLAHSNEGPSGLLGKAMVSGTRIVASGAISLRRDAATSPASVTWVPLVTADLADALVSASKSPSPGRQSVGSGDEFARRLLRTN